MSKGGRRVRIFSALEVANICGVVNQTAINWIRNGHLKAFTTPGGQYRIYAKDLAAFLAKRGMEASGEVLQVMMESANWNSFLIAAEQSANDSLKAKMETLLPDYIIFQAYDLFETGRKFIEEKPGFVLLDTELPGVDVSNFLHSVMTDPVFGRPYVILLTKDSSYDLDSSGSNHPNLVLTKPLDPAKLADAIKGQEKQLEPAITA